MSDLAGQIEAMRDDADAWGEPAPEPGRKRKSERRQRGAMVSVRFSPGELAFVQEDAAGAGMPVSGYLRSLALGSRPGVPAGDGCCHYGDTEVPAPECAEPSPVAEFAQVVGGGVVKVTAAEPTG